MEKLKDFDVTQIDKDTKVVVFRIPFNELYADSHDVYMQHISHIVESLKNEGIVALFVDNSVSVEPLTDELLNTKKLKSL